MPHLPPQNLLQVLFHSDYLALLGPVYDLDAHQHHALQILINLQQQIPSKVLLPKAELILEAQNQSILIAEDVKHCVQAQHALILLINPESHTGEQLRQRYLRVGENQKIDWTDISHFTKEVGITTSLNQGIVDQVLHALSISHCTDFHAEPRLSKLLSELKQLRQSINFSEVNLNWALNQLNLSESRFLHLFREHTGIPWRPFLLWQRLLCSIQAIAEGSSLTEAAQKAGFSDSAHFSRTFKANFGISASKILKISQFIQVQPD